MWLGDNHCLRRAATVDCGTVEVLASNGIGTLAWLFRIALQSPSNTAVAWRLFGSRQRLAAFGNGDADSLSGSYWLVPMSRPGTTAEDQRMSSWCVHSPLEAVDLTRRTSRPLSGRPLPFQHNGLLA